MLPNKAKEYILSNLSINFLYIFFSDAMILLLGPHTVLLPVCMNNCKGQFIEKQLLPKKTSLHIIILVQVYLNSILVHVMVNKQTCWKGKKEISQIPCLCWYFKNNPTAGYQFFCGTVHLYIFHWIYFPFTRHR